ncbi:MAG: YggS family pyridoxal phosphate-dependent enzyme [Proteobacteria bacterium]|nr:YggS family pyridoxal phosphate-dependent enzyme [Pseudomonadota bacterium]
MELEITKGIEKSFEQIQARISKACERSGRNQSDITLIGVTKNHPAQMIIESLRLGITNIGESYVQEAIRKLEETRSLLTPEQFKKITWHFIGKLQTNKIKHIRDNFSFIHSIDNQRQIEEISKRIDTPVSIFFEINTGDEKNKGGVKIDETRYLIEILMAVNETRRNASKPEITLAGLMCIPPLGDDPELSRPHFENLRKGLEILNNEFGINMKYLSMGMSNDFDIAIEEGSTHVRIGTLLYGERVYV